MKLPNYYEDPNTLHVGTCENRSYYIPYGQDLNSHATLLSGDWRFGYYPYPEAVPFLYGYHPGSFLLAVPRI